jgi:hypothetical protein
MQGVPSDPTEQREEVERQLSLWRKHMSAPENEAPVGMPAFGQLGRSDTAWVGITGVRVYSTGISLDVSIRLRREVRGVSFRLHELISGDRIRGLDIPSEHRLWLGVEYPDGRTTTNVQTHSWNDPDDGRIYLSSGGSRGGGRRHDADFWLSPLPPAGPLTFVCAWRLFNIPETRTMVDGDPIQDARSRTEILWPDEPDDDDQEAPEPPVPPSGWLTDAMNPGREET